MTTKQADPGDRGAADSSGLTTLRGKITKRIFSNPDTNFFVGLVAVEDVHTGRTKEIRVSGKFYAEMGDRVEITGRHAHNPKWGKQFEVVSGGVNEIDESPQALAHLLASSEEFEGIGPARAKAIVDAAMVLAEGGSFADALMAYPDEIAARARVKPELVRRAAEVWSTRKKEFGATASLIEMGWSMSQARKIIGKYGLEAPSIVGSDPYALIGKIERFGFQTVDAVGLKMGILRGDPRRISAGITYVLRSIGDNGHTWIVRDDLVREAVRELRPDSLDSERVIESCIEHLIKAELITIKAIPSGVEVLADPRTAHAEFFVFEQLTERLLHPMPGIDLGADDSGVFDSLNEGQAAAVRGALDFGAAIVSGGAGTGKSFSVRVLCEIASANHLSIGLCAPTGKAAKRLEQATGREAKTIHRLLEMSPTGDGWVASRNAANPLDQDLIIVDEASMVSVELMFSLVSALRPNARIVLVGDHNQIPSVGPGAILRDLLAARQRYQSVRILSHVVRQAGILARNTVGILEGVVSPAPSPEWSIVRTEKGHESGAAQLVVDWVEKLSTLTEIVPPFDRLLDPAWDIQVVAPMRKHELGTYDLNVRLQASRQRLLGNAPPPETEPGKPPKPLVGDRVIWTRNNYTLGLMNGTQAIVLETPKGGGYTLLVEEGGRLPSETRTGRAKAPAIVGALGLSESDADRVVEISASDRDSVEVAYALTIHKLQGSEFPCVILVISSKHYIMRDRNLLYTGASRASKMLGIVGDAAGIASFAKTIQANSRRTFGSYLAAGLEVR